MTQMDLTSYQALSNQTLSQWLETLPAKQNKMIQAMHHGLLLGGKRARPYLVYITGEMFGLKTSDLNTPAAAIECIHAYSLIHDDLPAMDDDDLRRGQPTCHKKFDEASAILAGDALQTLAFEILANGQLASQSESYRIELIKELAKASGANGMCLGQAFDLDAENKQVDLETLETIHRNKTGALIKCAVRMGAICAGEQGIKALDKLDRYAEAVGLAFQVHDDILDIISDTQTLGKPQGSDLEHNKSTYPALLGLDGAKQKALDLVADAQKALQEIPFDTHLLEAFANYAIERRN